MQYKLQNHSKSELPGIQPDSELGQLESYIEGNLHIVGKNKGIELNTSEDIIETEDLYASVSNMQSFLNTRAPGRQKPVVIIS